MLKEHLPSPTDVLLLRHPYCGICAGNLGTLECRMTESPEKLPQNFGVPGIVEGSRHGYGGVIEAEDPYARAKDPHDEREEQMVRDQHVLSMP